MKKYFIKNFSVTSLWGRKNYPLCFHDDVNVIIGPNASGKTTLINILFDSLNGNFPRLFRTDFSEVVINLKEFDGRGQQTLCLKRSEDEITISIGKEKHSVPMAPFIQFGDEFDYDEVHFQFRSLRRGSNLDIRMIQQRLRSLVSAVWLPVSRRLPITEEEALERRHLHREPLESVDECLAGLTELLQKYRLDLNIELSELRREFQRHALENILYDKQHDDIPLTPESFMPPSNEDKQALLKAFSDVGLINERMEERINEHFAAANMASAKLKNASDLTDMSTLFIVPLINRTRTIVDYAQKLENQRKELFATLHNFEEIVNSFLNEKSVKVSDRGELIISPQGRKRQPIEWKHLSSGEKQILILLTQALLSEKSPAVYVADEPELSLHVDWQEKLLKALTQLAGKCQFIVATHSPDIASGFGDNVIDLAKFK